jgi:hypothetical protein
MYKLYLKGNYVFLEILATGQKLTGFAKEVKIIPNSKQRTVYTILNIHGWSESTPLTLIDLQKENGVAYTESEFETFYTESTGNFSSASGGSGAEISINKINTFFLNASENNIIENDVILTEQISFGTIPTSGLVGYSFSSIDTSGLTQLDLFNPLTPLAPTIMNGALPTYDGVPLQGYSYLDINGTPQNTFYTIDLNTDADEIIFDIRGYSFPMHIIIDDKYVESINMPSEPVARIWLSFKGMGGSKFRTIKIRMNQDSFIQRAFYSKNVNFIANKKKPLVAYITDSLGATVSDESGFYAFPRVTSAYLGSDNMAFSQGNTGYVNASFTENFISRIPLINNVFIENNISPDFVLISGGINDDDNIDFYSNVKSTLALAKNTFVKSQIIVTGCWASADLSNQHSSLAKEVKIKQAALDVGVLFIPVMTDTNSAWITGTGTIDNPNGSGTSETLVKTLDITHWARIGHEIIGKKLAYSIVNVLNKRIS